MGHQEVYIRDRSSGNAYGVDGTWLSRSMRVIHPERVMRFKDEMTARVFARHKFKRPGQSSRDVELMLEGVEYVDTTYLSR